MPAPDTTPDQPPFPRWPSVVFGTLLLASAVWLCVAAVHFSTVQPDQFLVFFLALGGFAIGIVWVILAAVTLFGTPRHARPRRGLFLTALATPVCGLLAVALLISDADLLLRLKLSEPALRREAERLRADPDARRDTDRRVGLFRVRYASVTDTGAVRFVTDLPWIFEEAGLYHDPDRTITPTKQWPEHRARLTGPWATFYHLD